MLWPSAPQIPIAECPSICPALSGGDPTRSARLHVVDETPLVWVRLAAHLAAEVLCVGVVDGLVSAPRGVRGEALTAECTLILVEALAVQHEVFLQLKLGVEHPVAFGDDAPGPAHQHVGSIDVPKYTPLYLWR